MAISASMSLGRNSMTTLLQSPSFNATLADERQRALLLARREALIIELKALEEYLGLARTVKSHADRKREERYGPHDLG
jgi:hypothetical protein